MKLAIFLRARDIWGAERSLLTLLESDQADKHDIHVFIHPQSPLGPELDRIGVNWAAHDFLEHRSVAEGGLRHASFKSVAHDLAGIAVQGFKTRRLVSTFDTVLTFGLWETPEIALAGRLSRTPVIFDFHVTFGGRPGQLAIKGIMSLVTGVIAPANATFLQANILEPSAKRKVVVRPVNFPELVQGLQESPRRRKLRVGIFGQVDERKRVLEVARSLSPLREQLELLVVGTRPEEDQTDYERTVVSEVEGTGSGWAVLPRSNTVANLMADCDVILNMSRHEAFGRTVVEAVYMGAHPVVVSGGGPAEIVQQMGVGTVVSSWDELRVVLSTLSGKVATGESVRVNPDLVKNVRERYSPSSVAKEYFSAVTQLAFGNPSLES
ncbi:glycosyltransferase family 4 protein [Pseudarthrobacter enclensis]|uniref:glycosyltransferase family 4 protein n=1 Tax=Pseudarthrobacter enclensis TaxID=993070 RepID=UPI0036871D5C